jgi:hypothetical protein
VTGPKLIARALEEIRRIPSQWLDDFLRDFKDRLTVNQQRLINEALRPRSDLGLEEIPIPHGCGIDTVSDQIRLNTKPQPKLLTETQTPHLASNELDLSGIPTEYRTDVCKGIVKAKATGKLRNGAQLVVSAMAERFRSASGKPQDAMALTMYLAEHLNRPG